MSIIEFEINCLSWNGKKISFSADIDKVIPYKECLLVMIHTNRNFKYLKSDVRVDLNRNIICLNPDMTLKWEIFDMTDIFKDKNGKKSQNELPYVRMYFEGEKFICESIWGGGELIDPETGARLETAFEDR